MQTRHTVRHVSRVSGQRVSKGEVQLFTPHSHHSHSFCHRLELFCPDRPTPKPSVREIQLACSLVEDVTSKVMCRATQGRVSLVTPDLIKAPYVTEPTAKSQNKLQERHTAADALFTGGVVLQRKHVVPHCISRLIISPCSVSQPVNNAEEEHRSRGWLAVHGRYT